MKQTKVLLTDGCIQPQVMRDLLRGLGIRHEDQAIELLLKHGCIFHTPSIGDPAYYLSSQLHATNPNRARFDGVSRIADVLQLEFPRAAEKLRAQLAILVLERL